MMAKEFVYHPPKDDQAERYTRIRAAGANLADMVTDLCPNSHERDLAFDKIREAVMWANAAIACNE